MPIMTDIDRIIATARRDSRCVSDAETRALCDEIERLRAALQAIVDDDMDDTAVAIASKALGLNVFVGNAPSEKAGGGE